MSNSDFVISDNVLIQYLGSGWDIVLPQGITAIGERVFKGNKAIKKVVIPPGVISIGTAAFRECSNLVNVEIPDSVRTIERYAFYNCEKLSEVKLSSELQKIGGDAFRCTGIKQVTIPKSVVEIGNGCFAECVGILITVFDTVKVPLGEISFYCESRICVKNSETGEIKYVIYMGNGSGTSSSYCEAVIEGWKNGTDFDFNVFPEAFLSLRDAKEKREVAELRLRYPWNLNEEEKNLYIAYLKRGIKKYVTECANANDYEKIKFYDHFGLLQKTSLEQAIEESLNKGNNEMIAYLFELKKILPGKEKSAGTVLSLNGKAKQEWVTHKENPELVRRYQGNEREICFPTEINGLKITGIADAAAKLPENYLQITAVVIPEGYTIIGKNAFNGCTELQSVKLPSTLERIEKNAFYGCKKLKEIQLPDSLKYIGDNAFGGTDIQEFELFDNTIIGDYALGSAEVLISRGSFSGNHTNNHYIAQRLVYVYSDGIVDGTGLPGKTIMPLSYVGIKTNELIREENNLLKDKIVCSLGDLPALPKGISFFPRIMFEGFVRKCNGIPGGKFGKDTDILVVKDIDTGNATIQRAMKQGTLVITELEFLQSIRDGKALEKRDYSLEVTEAELKKKEEKKKSLNIDPKYKKAAIKKNWDFDLREDGTYILTRYKGKETIVTVPAFIDDIPVKEVADICYTYRSGTRESRRKELVNISEVIIEEGITEIGDFAFSGCKGLKKVVLPNSIKNIGDYAFSDCIELQDINLNDVIENIGSGALRRCFKLKDENGFIIFIKTLFGYDGNEETVIIPEGIIRISSDVFVLDAFSSRKGIKKIIIPDTVRYIDSGAFCNLVDLQDINIPDSVEECGESIFEGCKSLADDDGFIIINGRLYGYEGNDIKPVIPEGVNSIEKGVFGFSFDIKELTIPDSVRCIKSLPANDKLKIHASKDSYAYKYAVENEIRVV